MTDRGRLLDKLRPASFAIDYRMLGGVSEAEDVVQEALLRVHQALDDGKRIASPLDVLHPAVELRLTEGLPGGLGGA